jgi:hypothetical protein
MRTQRWAYILIFVLFNVVLAVPNHHSLAQQPSEQKLSGPEIKTLLENNTVHGIWEDREYFQYFDAKGPTTYLEVGSGASFGEWYVSETQFCSIWSHQVSCYDVLKDGKRYVWVIPSSQQRYTFEVFKGNQMPVGR